MPALPRSPLTILVCLIDTLMQLFKTSTLLAKPTTEAEKKGFTSGAVFAASKFQELASELFFQNESEISEDAARKIRDLANQVLLEVNKYTSETP